jgi:4-hydroxybenzoate polyprenyltransferase
MHNKTPSVKIGGIKQAPTPHNDQEHSHDHHHHSKSAQFRKFLLRITHSNSYVAIPVVAIGAATYLSIGSFDFDINYLAFLFFSTLLLYPLHRLIGVKMTIPVEFTKAQRAVDSKPLLTQVAAGIGLIGTLYFIWKIDFYTMQLLAPLGLISIAYSVPMIPTLNGWKRLRDIQGIKIYAISLVVSFTTSTIPLLLLGNVPVSDIVLLGTQRFIFILAITIPFDVRDAIMDKRWDLKTIPLIIGNANAINLAIGLVNFTTILAIGQFYYSHIFGVEIILAILLSNLWTSFILWKFRENNSALYNAFLVEGTMVVHFAFITIASVGVTLL